LLHDIGHLLHDLPDDAPNQGVDDRHEAVGAAWLSRWFIPAVAEPVRLHVAAKRYLCAAEPAYFQQLSQPSRLSLELQGGPMSSGEQEQFRASPHFSAAVLLRRWDEAAKVPGMAMAGIDEYLPDLQAALVRRQGAPRRYES
jgi:predicted HD phosphohydrolase